MYKKSELYGPRVKGDIDLGLEPSRIVTTQLAITGRDLARINTPGGLLPGGTPQDVYTPTVAQNYRMGSRRVMDDRVFHYGLATEALIRMMGALNQNQWPINGALVTPVIAGDLTITVPDAVGAVNAYAGGWVVLNTAPMQMRRILGNDVSDGVEVICYVDGAFELGAIAGTWVTGYPSIYSNIQAPPAVAPDYCSFVCVPLCTVPINNFFWGETWGPCYLVADSTVPGSTANARDVFFATSGNLLAGGVPPGLAPIGMQRAGYLLPRTAFGNGDQLFMLQLQP